ncbi:FtsX-like permease family protein [Candidatus Poribacteria bacterium]|nr:FtsX-like permease family protein [Candidatus Poribacteria bacterium]
MTERQGLIYFWRIHLAVLLGAAVATAVLTGALLVGDSVRGSLRDLTLDRLGRIDHALVSERFFREGLAADLSNEAVPAILLNGTAVDAKTQSRASRIQILGIDQRFTGLFHHAPEDLPNTLTEVHMAEPSVIINESLQKELNAKIGDPVLISLEKQSDIHREFLLGRRNHADVVATLRLTLTKVIPDRGIGRFGLRPHQSLPLNAYVSLSVLQKALDQTKQVNTILIAGKDQEISRSEDEANWQHRLHQVLKLDDLSLVLREREDFHSLESKRFLLKPDIIEIAKAVADENQVPFLTIMTYLANTISTNGREIPYSTITGIETGHATASLKLIDGSAAPSLADDEILLNEWAAKDLKVKVGESIDVSYFVVTPTEEYETQRAQFRLKGILALQGLAADRTLTPKFPGVHDADDMSDWDAPFPVDLKRVRPTDEAYWDKFGATPKAFVSAETGQRLWSSRFGNLTAIRFDAAQISKADLQRRLLEKIKPEQVGFVFQPVKAQGLEAASGTTDFSMLFIGFSLFLIVSAALLVGLLFRLGVEQRASEIGILLATGYPIATVRWRFLKEGGLLAGIGGVIGLGGATIYAWLMMVGLRTWWLAAVSTPFLYLHITPLSLLLGYFISIFVVLFSIWWTVRQFGRVPIRALIAGITTLAEKHAGRFARIFAFGGLGLAGVLLILALVSGRTSSAGLFFGSGTLLLISGLAFFSLWLRASRRAMNRTTIGMGFRNSARQPGRSMLCAALVACACFVIVAVGANRHIEAGGDKLPRKESGTGGFAWVAESDIPLHHDLNSEEGRFEMGFSESEAAVVASSQIVPFRVLPGEDASCLNLYQPKKPRILGVPADLIKRGGFQFQGQLGGEDNPWRTLESELEPGVIPAIGDYNSVLWILHLGLGKDLIIEDEFGAQLKLRLVGLLQSSIFQSEILISEANFTKHFPSRSGYGYFLIQSPSPGAGDLKQILESTLSDYGFDATSTAEKLANYQAVENTYLSTFQTLGGLGLLLGTLGLAILLLRNIIERRGELATLRAFGFRRATLSLMLLVENGFLLVVGMLIGSVSALIAVAPHLGTQIPWFSLSMTLILVFLVGIISSVVAVSFALRIPLLPALKAD